MNLTSIGERARHMSEVSTLREPTVRLIDRIQSTDPALQFRALALAFVVCAEALGLDPHEEVQRTSRSVAQAEGPFTHQVQAVRDYAADELARR